MLYPLAIQAGDRNTAFGVIVPDLPGFFSAGDTYQDALVNAREAISLHLVRILAQSEHPFWF